MFGESSEALASLVHSARHHGFLTGIEGRVPKDQLFLLSLDKLLNFRRLFLFRSRGQLLKLRRSDKQVARSNTVGFLQD